MKKFSKILDLVVVQAFLMTGGAALANEQYLVIDSAFCEPGPGGTALYVYGTSDCGGDKFVSLTLGVTPTMAAPASCHHFSVDNAAFECIQPGPMTSGYPESVTAILSCNRINPNGSAEVVSTRTTYAGFIPCSN